jgi:hypothetical protein
MIAATNAPKNHDFFGSDREPQGMELCRDGGILIIVTDCMKYSGTL